jgi:hypothetical protein
MNAENHSELKNPERDISDFGIIETPENLQGVSEQVANFFTDVLRSTIEDNRSIYIRPTEMKPGSERGDQTICVDTNQDSYKKPIAIISKNSVLSNAGELRKFLEEDNLKIVFSRVYSEDAMTDAKDSQSYSKHYKAGLSNEKGNVLLFAQKIFIELEKNNDDETHHALASLQLLEKLNILQEIQEGNLTPATIEECWKLERLKPIIEKLGGDENMAVFKKEVEAYSIEARDKIEQAMQSEE